MIQHVLTNGFGEFRSSTVKQPGNFRADLICMYVCMIFVCMYIHSTCFFKNGWSHPSIHDGGIIASFNSLGLFGATYIVKGKGDSKM